MFASSALTGRVGRAFLQPLSRLANAQRTGRAREDAAELLCHPEGTLGDRLRFSLRWWVLLLREAPPRGVLSPMPRSRFEGWTDAALTPWGLGGVFTGSGRLAATQCFGCRLDGRLVRWLPPTHLQRQAVFQLELCAVLLFLELFGPEVRGGSLRLFVDNEDARCYIISGYTANARGARIVAQIWVEAARWDISLWIERAPSKENPADHPSRDRWTMAERLRWDRVRRRRVDGAVAKLEKELDRHPDLKRHRFR